MIPATTRRKAAAARFVCTRCTTSYPRWPGARCKACGAFATAILGIDECRARGVPLPISMLGDETKASRQRWRTGIRGFDTILSHEGGIVPAASVLLASCPGGGKTTLLLASCGAVACGRRRVVYASAEQDTASLRALGEKLGVHQRDRLLPISIRSVGDVEAAVRASNPRLVVVDSATEVAKHSRTQPQAVAAALHEMAHATNTAIIATAHVNREGLVRGGPELEHATDAVLMLMGDPRKSPRRELSASKNRHGPTTLTALIEVTARGFVDVDQGPGTHRRALGIGAALAVVRVDGKAATVEVQALISPSTNPSQRKITTSGCSVERVRVLVAVAEREGIEIAGDVTVRCYGGADDPGLDAAIVAAIHSASQQRALPAGIAFAGEVGLSGDLRPSDVAESAERLGVRLVGRPGERLLTSLDRAHLSRVV